jgi:hypothetical protein
MQVVLYMDAIQWHRIRVLSLMSTTRYFDKEESTTCAEARTKAEDNAMHNAAVC